MKQKKYTFFIYFILAVILFCSCNEDTNRESTCPALPNNFSPTETQALFLELAFDQEFGQSTDRLRKWDDTINIFIEGNISRRGSIEIDTVLKELNELSTAIPINTVTDKSEANLILFLGSMKDYVALVEPSVAGIAEGNSGFAVISWNDQNEIIKASACVDIVNFTGLIFFKHVLREELAQALGIINDSKLDEKSVFFQLPNLATNYSERDKEIIAYILGDDLSAGMCKTEVLNIVD